MKRLLAFAMMTAAMLPAGAAVADGNAVATMAAIVMHLDHYPTVAEKTTLQGIIDSNHATAGEKTLAGALLRMRHQVSAADAAKLRALAADARAAHEERELADILLGINHHPSAAAKQRLKDLLD